MDRRKFLLSVPVLTLACSPTEPAVSLRYLAAGDSITKDRDDGNIPYPTLAAADPRFSSVTNSGTDSWKITDLRTHLAEKVLNFEPNIVSLMFGTNDHQIREADPSWHVTLADYEEAYRDVIETIPAKLVLITPPFITGIPGRHDDTRLQLYAAVVRRLAIEYRTGFVDVHSLTMNLCGGDPVIYRARWTDTDGIHLNSAAHAIIYPAILGGLLSV